MKPVPPPETGKSKDAVVSSSSGQVAGGAIEAYVERPVLWTVKGRNYTFTMVRANTELGKENLSKPAGETWDDFTFDEYKSLSAQDFRKGIRREERLALDKDDVSSTVDSQDMDRGSLRSARFSPTASVSSFCSFNYNPPSLDEIFPVRPLTLLDSSNKEKLSKEVDDELTSLLRNSQSENTRLKVELKALESLLESAKFQLKSTKEKVSEDNVEYEKDKEEDQEVAKKMAEMEEELKMLSYSESLTDQALGQLKADNERLRGERGSLLQVLYKLSRIN